jgi:glutaredoxin-related protein
MGAEDKLSYHAALLQLEGGPEIVDTLESSDSVYRFIRLPAGRYRLQVEDHAHDRTIERPVVLTADQEIVIDLLEKEP